VHQNKTQAQVNLVNVHHNITHTLNKIHTQSYRFLIVAYFSKFDWCSVQCLGFFYIIFQKFSLSVEMERDPNRVRLSETANL